MSRCFQIWRPLLIRGFSSPAFVYGLQELANGKHSLGENHGCRDERKLGDAGRRERAGQD